MYLLDTNILSELRKIGKPKVNKGVETWANSVDSRLFFINTIVLLEQQKWLLLAHHKKDPAQAQALADWLDLVIIRFGDRTLPITAEIALTCAALHVPNPRPAHDALIAATALVHDLTLVTRNTADFKGIDGLSIINPFS